MLMPVQQITRLEKAHQVKEYPETGMRVVFAVVNALRRRVNDQHVNQRPRDIRLAISPGTSASDRNDISFCVY